MGYYMGGDFYSPRGDYYAAGGVATMVGKGIRVGQRIAKSPVGKKLGGQLIKVGGRILRRKTGGLGVHRRHHRMNPLNPRALRRAIRRTHSFAKFARKVMTFQHHHKFKKGRWGGHRRKARA